MSHTSLNLNTLTLIPMRTHTCTHTHVHACTHTRTRTHTHTHTKLTMQIWSGEAETSSDGRLQPAHARSQQAGTVCQLYSFLHKSVKWWRKVFFWMLEVAVINAYIIYKKLAMAQGRRPMTHKASCRVLIDRLSEPLRSQAS